MGRNELYEELNPALTAIAVAFDEYCAKNNIEYTIESDECNEQAYHVKLDDVAPIKSNMDEACADHKVFMRVEEDKFGHLFLFRLEPIQEDQYKHPTRRHLRSQSAFRSSFDKSKSFGGTNEGFETSLQRRLDEGVIGIVPMNTLMVLSYRNGHRINKSNNDQTNQLLQKANEMLQMAQNDSIEHSDVISLLHTIIGKLSNSEDGDKTLDDIIDSEIQ